MRRVIAIVALCTSVSAPAFASTIIFTDGAINGTLNGVFIDGPGGVQHQTISDGFIATDSGTADSLDFGEWVPTGSTPTAVSWSLGTAVFANDISFGSNVPVTSFTFLLTNGFGFDVFRSHVTGLSGNLTAGNAYFLTLGGATDTGGGDDAWDVNGGIASCGYATNNVPLGDCGVGGGEAFTLNALDAAGPVPEPGTITMLLGGLVGLTGVVRRKLNVQ